MHGEDWNVGQKYFAIYWLHIRGQGEIPSAMFENDENHAEINLLRHLTAFLPAIGNGMLLSVTIMQNGSPCSSKVGIILKTAQFQDWKALRIVLQLPDILEEAYKCSPGKDEDEVLREDLDFILKN
nr:hypothetical protein BaRGS_003631 [Batillaria attramentaria]